MAAENVVVLEYDRSQARNSPSAMDIDEYEEEILQKFSDERCIAPVEFAELDDLSNDIPRPKVETRAYSKPTPTNFADVVNQASSNIDRHFSQRVKYICKDLIGVKDLTNCNDLQIYIHALFCNTLRLTLSTEWKTATSRDSKNLRDALLQVDSRACETLAALLPKPWGEEIVLEVLHGRFVPKVLDSALTIGSGEHKNECAHTCTRICAKEPRSVLRTRVELLCYGGLKTEALRLCLFYRRCPVLSEDHFYDKTALHLLYHMGNVCHTIDEMQNLSCHDGFRLIQLILNDVNAGYKVYPLAECLTQILLVQDLVGPSTYCCTLPLMEMWCTLHVKQGTLLADVEREAQKLGALATMSAHLYLLVDVLYKQYGRSLLPLYLNLYVHALTIDFNNLEFARQVESRAGIAEIETHMSGMYTKLASLLATEESRGLARECVLTAFSLEPTIDRLANLKSYAVYHPNKWSFNHVVRLVPCSGECHCSEKGLCRRDPVVPPWFMTHVPNGILDSCLRGVSKQLLQDLCILVEGPRCRWLTWNMPWENLHDLCMHYLTSAREFRANTDDRGVGIEARLKRLGPFDSTNSSSYKGLVNPVTGIEECQYGHNEERSAADNEIQINVSGTSDMKTEASAIAKKGMPDSGESRLTTNRDIFTVQSKCNSGNSLNLIDANGAVILQRESHLKQSANVNLILSRQPQNLKNNLQWKHQDSASAVKGCNKLTTASPLLARNSDPSKFSQCRSPSKPGFPKVIQTKSAGLAATVSNLQQRLGQDSWPVRKHQPFTQLLYKKLEQSHENSSSADLVPPCDVTDRARSPRLTPAPAVPSAIQAKITESGIMERPQQPLDRESVVTSSVKNRHSPPLTLESLVAEVFSVEEKEKPYPPITFERLVEETLKCPSRESPSKMDTYEASKLPSLHNINSQQTLTSSSASNELGSSHINVEPAPQVKRSTNNEQCIVAAPFHVQDHLYGKNMYVTVQPQFTSADTSRGANSQTQVRENQIIATQSTSAPGTSPVISSHGNAGNGATENVLHSTVPIATQVSQVQLQQIAATHNPAAVTQQISRSATGIQQNSGHAAVWHQNLGSVQTNPNYITISAPISTPVQRTGAQFQQVTGSQNSGGSLIVSGLHQNSSNARAVYQHGGNVQSVQQHSGIVHQNVVPQTGIGVSVAHNIPTPSTTAKVVPQYSTLPATQPVYAITLPTQSQHLPTQIRMAPRLNCQQPVSKSERLHVQTVGMSRPVSVQPGIQRTAIVRTELRPTVSSAQSTIQHQPRQTLVNPQQPIQTYILQPSASRKLPQSQDANKEMIQVQRVSTVISSPTRMVHQPESSGELPVTQLNISKKPIINALTALQTGLPNSASSTPGLSKEASSRLPTMPPLNCTQIKVSAPQHPRQLHASPLRDRTSIPTSSSECTQALPSQNAKRNDLSSNSGMSPLQKMAVPKVAVGAANVVSPPHRNPCKIAANTSSATSGVLQHKPCIFTPPKRLLRKSFNKPRSDGKPKWVASYNPHGKMCYSKTDGEKPEGIHLQAEIVTSSRIDALATTCSSSLPGNPILPSVSPTVPPSVTGNHPRTPCSASTAVGATQSLINRLPTAVSTVAMPHLVSRFSNAGANRFPDSNSMQSSSGLAKQLAKAVPVTSMPLLKRTLTGAGLPASTSSPTRLKYISSIVPKPNLMKLSSVSTVVAPVVAKPNSTPISSTCRPNNAVSTATSVACSSIIVSAATVSTPNLTTAFGNSSHSSAATIGNSACSSDSVTFATNSASNLAPPSITNANSSTAIAGRPMSPSNALTAVCSNDTTATAEISERNVAPCSAVAAASGSNVNSTATLTEETVSPSHQLCVVTSNAVSSANGISAAANSTASSTTCPNSTVNSPATLTGGTVSLCNTNAAVSANTTVQSSTSPERTISHCNTVSAILDSISNLTNFSGNSTNLTTATTWSPISSSNVVSTSSTPTVKSTATVLRPNTATVTSTATVSSPNVATVTSTATVSRPNATTVTSTATVSPPNVATVTSTATISHPNATTVTSTATVLPPNVATVTSTATVSPPNAANGTSATPILSSKVVSVSLPNCNSRTSGNNLSPPFAYYPKIVLSKLQMPTVKKCISPGILSHASFRRVPSSPSVETQDSATPKVARDQSNVNTCGNMIPEKRACLTQTILNTSKRKELGTIRMESNEKDAVHSVSQLNNAPNQRCGPTVNALISMTKTRLEVSMQQNCNTAKAPLAIKSPNRQNGLLVKLHASKDSCYCPVCDKALKRKSLRMHMLNIHKNSRQLVFPDDKDFPVKKNTKELADCSLTKRVFETENCSTTNLPPVLVKDVTVPCDSRTADTNGLEMSAPQVNEASPTTNSDLKWVGERLQSCREENVVDSKSSSEDKTSTDSNSVNDTDAICASDTVSLQSLDEDGAVVVRSPSKKGLPAASTNAELITRGRVSSRHIKPPLKRCCSCCEDSSSSSAKKCRSKRLKLGSALKSTHSKNYRKTRSSQRNDRSQ